MLTAIILTYNEEDLIETALKTVDFADEIIVIDNGSEDATRDIAQRRGAHVYNREHNGDFAAQRNYGMEKAHGDWILFVDADERITPELKAEIMRAVTSPKEIKFYDAYNIRRIDYFWGKKIKHGEVKLVSERGLTRLMRKGVGKWEGKVHETFKLNFQGFDETGDIGTLDGDLNHFPHHSIKEFLEKVNSYSTLRAKELYEQGKRSNIFTIVVLPIGKFLYTYFLRFGYKDGAAGFVYSFMMSFHSFLTRSKLYLLAHSKKK